MNIEQERQRRPNTLRYLESEGLVEGRDWCWGAITAWDLPGVIDEGEILGVTTERLVPKDAEALPIMIRSSGVRLLGGVRLAAAMDAGQFPSEMPFRKIKKIPPGLRHCG